jgi:hypothetical protein
MDLIWHTSHTRITVYELIKAYGCFEKEKHSVVCIVTVCKLSKAHSYLSTNHMFYLAGTHVLYITSSYCRSLEEENSNFWIS